MSRIVFRLTQALRLSSAAFLITAISGCAMQSPAIMGLGSHRPSPAPSSHALAQPPGSQLPPGASSRGAVVIVQDGETISDLSQRHKVSISTIMSENRLKDPNIFPGMVLLMPKR